ncbi:MAG TPA: hypothetical protein VGO07_07480, partial [Candidatus Saccharimonadales bacterium]|nr:hypothetical protein [Candidatus Saccharimonadales bacterium]
MTAVHELSAQSVTAGIDPTLAYGQQERNLDAERQAAIAVGDVTNACLAEAEKRGVEAIDFLDPHGAVARSGDTAYVVDVMQPGTNGHERTASEHVKSGTSNVAGSLSSGVGVARFYAVPGQHPQDPGRDYVLIRPDGKFVVGTTRNQQGFGDMLTQNNYTVTGPSQPGRPDMFDAVSGRPLLAELDAKKRSQEQHLGRAVQANDVVEARKLAAQRAGLTPFQLSRELPRDSVALQVSADSPVLREYVESDAAVAAKRGMPVAAAAASRVGCVYINPDTGNFLINSGNDVIIG